MHVELGVEKVLRSRLCPKGAVKKFAQCPINITNRVEDGGDFLVNRTARVIRSLFGLRLLRIEERTSGGEVLVFILPL